MKTKKDTLHLGGKGAVIAFQVRVAAAELNEPVQSQKAERKTQTHQRTTGRSTMLR
jgi:hypothetical protein